VVRVAFNRIVMLTGYADPAETVVTCPDQDVVCDAGYCALDTEPIIFQVPDFGGRLWVCCRHDGRAEEFSQLGKQYGTGPRFNLLAGRAGAVRLLRCHGDGALVHGVAVRGPVYFPERHGLPCRLWRLLARGENDGR